MSRASAVVLSLLVVWSLVIVQTALVGGHPDRYEPASVDLSEAPSEVAADAFREAATRDVTAELWRSCDVENASVPTEDGLCQLYWVALDREDDRARLWVHSEPYDAYAGACNWFGDAENDTWQRLGKCTDPGDPTGWFLSPGAADLSSLTDVSVIERTEETLVLHVGDTEAVTRLWLGEDPSTFIDQDARIANANATVYVDRESSHLRGLDLVRVESDGESRTVEWERIVYSDWDSTDVERPDGVSYSVWEALAEARP